MSTGQRLRDLLASGELHRLARACRTKADLAAALGMTAQAYRKARDRIPGFPSFPELQGAALEPSGGEIVEVIEEEKTAPNLTAADVREQVEKRITNGVPVPAMPPGHVLRGASTLVRPDGSVVQQWVKTRADEDQREQLLQAWNEAIKGTRGLADPIEPPRQLNEKLLACYPLGDPHIGMFSWRPETGHDFDLKIAERNLYAAADHLVAVAPPAKRALVVNLGDFFHSDGQSNTTTKGTRVDVDGRWAKVLTVGVGLMRRIIDRTLEKHEHVTVVNEIGNHDSHAAVMLSIALAQFYEREPRVFIDTSPAKFHWYRFGKVLIGITHTDTLKIEKLPAVMAHDRAQDWGETLHRYWLTGHVHHRRTMEFPGCICKSYGTMAPGDAWHHGQGYRSAQEMCVEVYHEDYGEIARHSVGIHQLAGLA